MKKAKNHRSKVKTLPAHQLPFEDSLVLMILNKCEKIVHDLHKCSLYVEYS